jgi:tetratricopeptide (TPR) repeat protein
MDCHGNENCSVEPTEFTAMNGNCIECHMPPSSSIDIPHVSITDHYIRKDYSGSHVSMDEYFPETPSIFQMKLECLTDEAPSNLTMTRGYLAFYERFQSDPAMLDSAAHYLKMSSDEALDERVHHAYLSRDFLQITKLAANTDTGLIDDAWTAYRIGEAYNEIGDFSLMVQFYEHAYRLMPLNLRFADKYGTALFKSRDFESAKDIFTQLINLNPKVAKHWYNMGYYWMSKPDIDKAKIYFNQALKLDPDYQPAIEAMNKLEVQSGI